jgi:hypothetical protein
MQIAGFKFRAVTGQVLYSGPGIYIYTHQATGKSFVRAMRNCRAQRSKNNYPNLLKELLKTNPSEVLLFMAEITKDTKDALYLSSRAVLSHLSERGVLYKRPSPNRGGAYRVLPGEEKIRFTVWKLCHRETGAVFYFEEISTVPELAILARISQRMLTFNNYVLKTIPNANRAMYYFVKHHGLTDISHWDITDLAQEFESEHKAMLYITRLSKQHLEAGEVVLSRISSVDALYYRNSMLRLPHASMEEYLGIAQ